MSRSKCLSGKSKEYCRFDKFYMKRDKFLEEKFVILTYCLQITIV
jgi:hypothetical protein